VTQLSSGRFHMIVAVVFVVATLSGCSNPTGPTQKTAADAPGDSTNRTGSTTNDSDGGTSVKGTRITLPCDLLITPKQLSTINPSLTPAPGYHPAKGSHAETIIGLDGLVCAWLDNKNNQTVEVAVAQLPDAAITTLKNETITVSKAVPTYGAWPTIEGYFQKTDGTGVATVFRGPYWIETSSTAYFEPGDAQLVTDAVLKALP
jgi:hypothetical protein